MESGIESKRLWSRVVEGIVAGFGGLCVVVLGITS